MEQSEQNTNPSGKNANTIVPQQDGVLVLNKPGGISSAACIARVKRFFGQKKIGHAGTLDPMATGVLLVLLGQATKISGYLLDHGKKVYSGSICLGVETDTWDAEGAVLAEKSVDGITEEAVLEAMAELVGTYEQEVPAYSAAKHNGQPLYALARKGLETPVKKKVITIFRGEVESVNLPHVRFRVHCSSGTYIRSLAHSLGKRLGCGGMLEELTREYSHPFGLDVACSLDGLQQQPERFIEKVQSFAAALPAWPVFRLDAGMEGRVRNGMCVDYSAFAEVPLFQEGINALFESMNGAPLALASSAMQGGKEVWVVSRGLWN